MKKPRWETLTHEDKLKILRSTTVDQIAADYSSDDADITSFKARLGREFALWRPAQATGKPLRAGKPPNKEVVLGAWRDLDRSEALLELIDNSIDAWKRRREQYPDKSAPELNIYIDIDSEAGQLTYEDNAGGVPVDKLVNLVVPGHSDTDAFAHSIGSYKTGGKKAIFRLAKAVNITTHFWNPAETGNEISAVHLDENWLTDVTEYEFPYFKMASHGDLQRGQTRYVMQLREEPIGAHWYRTPHELSKIEREIQQTYGLLIARNKDIKIYFPRRGMNVVPTLDAMYDFSGASGGKMDIRPQHIEFETTLELQGKKHPLTIEVVIGCRVTTGSRDHLGPGFDLYGNNRLFTYRDERLFADQLPKGAATGLVRGWVNILGPNVFVPWDTHKRHLNYDREVIDLIRTHPAIKELFENWKSAYNRISGLGRGELTKTIDVEHRLMDPKAHRLRFGHTDRVPIDALKKRGQKLPASIFQPIVRAPKKKDMGVQLTMMLTTDEARRLAAYFQIHGSLDAPSTKRNLSDKAKTQLLALLQPSKTAKRS